VDRNNINGSRRFSGSDWPDHRFPAPSAKCKRGGRPPVAHGATIPCLGWLRAGGGPCRRGSSLRSEAPCLRSDWQISGSPAQRKRPAPRRAGLPKEAQGYHTWASRKKLGAKRPGVKAPRSPNGEPPQWGLSRSGKIQNVWAAMSAHGAASVNKRIPGPLRHKEVRPPDRQGH
jgi:hypothetical protein